MTQMMFCMLVFIVELLLSTSMAMMCTNVTSCIEALDQLKTEADMLPPHPYSSLLTAAVNLASDEIQHLTGDEIREPSSSPQIPPTVDNLCPNKGAFEFIVAHQATVKLNSSVGFTPRGWDACFKTMHVEFFDRSPDGKIGGDKWGYVHFTVPAPSKLVCSDSYFVGTKFGQRPLSVGTINHLTKKMHVNITYCKCGAPAHKSYNCFSFCTICNLNPEFTLFFLFFPSAGRVRRCLAKWSFDYGQTMWWFGNDPKYFGYYQYLLQQKRNQNSSSQRTISTHTRLVRQVYQKRQ